MAIVINGSGTVTGISVGGLPDDIVDAGTLADDAVGLAQMAAGTDGNVITYDASGNPAVVATGSSGQVLTSAGADAVPTMATLSAGKILQVVNATLTSEVHTSSASFVDFGLSAAITPSANSSKILILVTIPCTRNGNTAGVNQPLILLRDTTQIVVITSTICNTGTAYNNNDYRSTTGQWLDSPSTTSATTYKLQHKRNSGTGNIYWNTDTGNSQRAISCLTLFEIGA